MDEQSICTFLPIEVVEENLKGEKEMRVIKIFILISILILVAGSIPLQAGEEDVIELFSEGIENYHLQNYDRAISNFSDILEREELSHEIYIDSLYYQTLAYIELARIKEAKDNIEVLDDEGYEFGRLYWSLAKVYLNEKGQFDSPYYNEAKRNLEKASMIGVDTAEFHSDLAKTYRELDMKEKAVKEYELAIKNSDKPSDYRNIASLHKDLGNIDEALDYYKKARESGSESTSIYINMGELYIEKNDIEKAVEILKEGKEHSPNNFVLRYHLGRAFYESDKREEARNELEEVVELKNNFYHAYYYLGLIYSQEEDWQRAVYNFEQATKYNPNYARAYIELGDIYLEQDNVYKAISQYTSAIEANEDYAKGHFHLAKAYLKRDMTESAISELRRTIHLDSDHDEAKNLLEELTEE